MILCASLVVPRCEQNGLDPPSVEVSLPVEDGSDVQMMDDLERTCDGKYKCSYCSYANKGMARLIEHTRIHTGMIPEVHVINSFAVHQLHYMQHTQYKNNFQTCGTLCK